MFFLSRWTAFRAVSVIADWNPAPLGFLGRRRCPKPPWIPQPATHRSAPPQAALPALPHPSIRTKLRVLSLLTPSSRLPLIQIAADSIRFLQIEPPPWSSHAVPGSAAAYVVWGCSVLTDGRCRFCFGMQGWRPRGVWAPSGRRISGGKKVFVHANLNVPLDDAQKIRGKKRKILVALRHLHLLRPIPHAWGRRVSDCMSPRSLTPAVPSKLVIGVFHAFNLVVLLNQLSAHIFDLGTGFCGASTSELLTSLLIRLVFSLWARSLGRLLWFIGEFSCMPLGIVNVASSSLRLVVWD
jgi:hypothetical protein